MPKPKKNQLFRVLPTKEFVQNYLKLFSPGGFENEYFQFTRDDIKNKKITKTMKNDYFNKHFIKFYLPCKYRKYLQNVDEKKAITILRQLLKVYDYNIISSEKYSRGNKFLVYKLKNMNVKNDTKKEKKYDLVLHFD
jgi:hypothetical protein